MCCCLLPRVLPEPTEPGRPQQHAARVHRTRGAPRALVNPSVAGVKDFEEIGAAAFLKRLSIMGVAKGEATRASTHELGWTSKSVLEKELKAYHGRRSTGRLAIWFVVCAVLVYSIIAPSMFFFIPGEAQRLNRYRSTRQLIPNSADLHLAGAVAFASTLAGELAAALVSSEPQAMVPSMGISICGAICYLSIGAPNACASSCPSPLCGLKPSPPNSRGPPRYVWTSILNLASE